MRWRLHHTGHILPSLQIHHLHVVYVDLQAQCMAIWRCSSVLTANPPLLEQKGSTETAQLWATGKCQPEVASQRSRVVTHFANERVVLDRSGQKQQLGKRGKRGDLDMAMCTHLLCGGNCVWVIWEPSLVGVKEEDVAVALLAHCGGPTRVFGIG
jgi:hypothetical protein